ncbi:PglL family O-oligosaccharyltransferase [Providencia sp. Me31A]|uniref:PglL family O-oligosaccharyltransferase n=1 Tax=Providencia sp. Me31A TaxID=3392637 RepID=UPI003D284CFC
MNERNTLSKVNNRKERNYPYFPWGILGCVIVFFGVIVHVYLPNLGGAGLSLPLNIITGFFISFLIVLINVIKINKNYYHYSVSGNFISIGLIILILLCFVSPREYQYNAYLTAYWLVGALLFYQVLMQVYISKTGFEIILWGILSACFIESILVIAEVFNLLPILWLPYPPVFEGRPYGIFQQVNVLSSFVCTGIASAIGLLMIIRDIKWYSFFAIIFSLILISAILPLTQSLTGYLSLFLIIIVFYFFAKYHRRKFLYAFSAIIIGIIIGHGVKIGVNIPDFTESKLQTSHIRWILWQYSLVLFSENILLGTGVGSFETVFLDRFGGALLGVGEKTFSHPHNEILRWVVEGGLIGISAVLCILLGGLYLMRTSLRNKNKNYICLFIASPIVLHMMTEFPLLVSMPHGVILILLLRCADIPAKKFKLNTVVSYLLKGIAIISGSVSMVLLYFTLQTQQYLTYIERTGQQFILSLGEAKYNHWQYVLINDRYQLDLNMGYLLNYNNTQDFRYLNLFKNWAELYSRSYPDVNVYYSWILVLDMLGEKEEMNRVIKKAIYLFGEDERIEQLSVN